VQALADDDGGVALGELEDLVGLLHLFVPDQVEDLTSLVRRHAHVAHDGARTGTLVGLHSERRHQRRPRTAFSWPAW
jgi:hypothetical protein